MFQIERFSYHGSDQSINAQIPDIAKSKIRSLNDKNEEFSPEVNKTTNETVSKNILTQPPQIITRSSVTPMNEERNTNPGNISFINVWLA